MKQIVFRAFLLHDISLLECSYGAVWESCTARLHTWVQSGSSTFVVGFFPVRIS